MKLTAAVITLALLGNSAVASEHHAPRPKHKAAFSMKRCLQAAKPIYSPSEAKAACLDLKFGL